MLNRWPSFTRFLEAGCIPLSNNVAERALKYPILGRKAWLFVGNHTAGETAAKLITLTKTCNRLAHRSLGVSAGCVCAVTHDDGG